MTMSHNTRNSILFIVSRLQAVTYKHLDGTNV